MEDDPREIKSPLLNKPSVKMQIKLLESIVEQAEKRIDFTLANDEAILKAIDSVERFLRKKRRVCYGGQAINALLSKERKFYDEKYMIPDYDFFSPSMEEDVEELIKDLEKEGFTDISKKLSVHDGTIKVYVNYIPIADCSQMNPEMFKTVQKRAKSVDGILYCDADILRMFMFLELSRPRGEVARWKKVFERLTLLNNEYPVRGCSEEIIVNDNIGSNIRSALLNYCIKKKSVMVGPEFIENLEKDKGATSLSGLANRGGSLMFMSATPMIDAENIKYIVQNSGKRGQIFIHEYKSPSDHIYSYVTVKQGNNLIAMIFEEDSCHAYTILKVDNLELRVGTPDLMLHLYYTLSIFGKKNSYFQTPIDCLIGKLFVVSEKARSHPSKFIPAFGLRCSGHQQGIATLLRLKAERYEKKGNKTRKNKKN